MGEVILVCEGPAGGRDAAFLNALCLHRRLDVTVVAAGGAGSVGQMHDWLEQEAFRREALLAADVPAALVFSVRDRDFHPEESAAATWTEARARRLMWRRHEIENYLVEPSLVLAFFHALPRNHPALASALPPDAQGVGELLSGFAAQRLDHHAGQLAFADLQAAQDRYTGDGGTALRRPKLDGNRSAPPTEQDWVLQLQAEARELRRNCTGLAASPELTDAAVAHAYGLRQREVRAEDFLLSRRWLADMEGKNLLWALWAWLHDRGLPKLTLDDVAEHLIRAIPDACDLGLLDGTANCLARLLDRLATA